MNTLSTTSIDEKTSLKGLVLEIQKLSTEDGPGIRTSIFLKGCPLKCDWCHNPESIPTKQGIQWFEIKCIGCKTCVEICPDNALKFDDKGLQIDREKCSICGKCVEECPSTALQIFGLKWSVADLLHEVEKDRVYYEKSGGGVTVSGGEPTMQTDFVVEFLKQCKEKGLMTAFDTCGYTSLKNLKRILPFVDLFLYDLKEIDSAKHNVFTGVPNETILQNCIWLAQKLREDGKKLWIRTPIIPQYTATEENVRGIAKFIVNELKNKIERWDLLAFNNLATDKYQRMDIQWSLQDIPLLKKEDIESLYDVAIEEGAKNVQWSGLTQSESKDNQQ